MQFVAVHKFGCGTCGHDPSLKMSALGQSGRRTRLATSLTQSGLVPIGERRDAKLSAGLFDRLRGQ